MKGSPQEELPGLFLQPRTERLLSKMTFLPFFASFQFIKCYAQHLMNVHFVLKDGKSAGFLANVAPGSDT